MARKLWISGLVLFVSALAVTIGVASAASDITGPVTISVIEHPSHDKIIDIGAKGDSPGDMFMFHNQLFDETDTTLVGTDSGMCIREAPKQGIWECWWTITLADGQITAEGPFSDTADTDLFAVTGGTGIYENVRGSAVETLTAAGTYVLTYNLIP